MASLCERCDVINGDISCKNGEMHERCIKKCCGGIQGGPDYWFAPPEVPVVKSETQGPLEPIRPSTTPYNGVEAQFTNPALGQEVVSDPICPELVQCIQTCITTTS